MFNYTGQDQFSRGVAVLLYCPYIGSLYSQSNSFELIYILILMAFFLYVLFLDYRFLSYLYKLGSKNRNYIYALSVSIIVALIGPLIESLVGNWHYLLVIWFLFLSIIYSRMVYNENIDYAETLGVYNKRKT